MKIEVAEALLGYFREHRLSAENLTRQRLERIGFPRPPLQDVLLALWVYDYEARGRGALYNCAVAFTHTDIVCLYTGSTIMPLDADQCIDALLRKMEMGMSRTRLCTGTFHGCE